MNDPVSVVKRALRAFAESDREVLEAVIADDFRFTSPLDNGLDRKTYFERCWPNNEHIKGIDCIASASEGDRAWVMYEGFTNDKRFRNAEVYTVRGGRITEALVFFGWDVPHPAAAGSFVGNDDQDEA